MERSLHEGVQTLMSPTRAAPQFLPLSILRMLCKQIVPACALALVLAGAAAWVISRMPDIYRAEAVVLVDSQKIPEKFVSSTVQVSLQDNLNAIKQQVLSANRIQEIAEEFHLYEQERGVKTIDEVIERVRRDLSVELERGLGGGRSGAFRITFDAASPKLAAGVVNRVTQLFIRENFRTREQRAEGTSEFIERELKIAKQRLDQQEASLSEYKRRWVGELPQQEPALLGALNRLQTELIGNQEAIDRAQQNSVMLENTLRFAESSLATATRALTPPPAPADPVARRDPGPAAPPPPSAALRAQLEQARLRYYEDHPEVKRLRLELDRALAEEARLAGPLKPAETETRAPDPPKVEVPVSVQQAAVDVKREQERIAMTKGQIEMVNEEIARRTREREKILDQIRAYQSRVETLPIREQQLAALTRDYETSKANYHSLLDKKINASMATDMERSDQSERFTIADPARVPAKPVKPRRLLLYPAAALGAFAFSLALFFGLELKKNLFLGEWELPPDLRVLGRIATIQTPLRAETH